MYTHIFLPSVQTEIVIYFDHRQLLSKVRSVPQWYFKNSCLESSKLIKRQANKRSFLWLWETAFRDLFYDYRGPRLAIPKWSNANSYGFSVVGSPQKWECEGIENGEKLIKLKTNSTPTLFTNLPPHPIPRPNTSTTAWFVQFNLVTKPRTTQSQGFRNCFILQSPTAFFVLTELNEHKILGRRLWNWLVKLNAYEIMWDTWHILILGKSLSWL